MIIQGKRDAVYDGVYGGFAASESAPGPRPQAAPPWPGAPRTQPRRRFGLAAGGALIAVVAGVGFGLLGRPELGVREPPPPMAPAAPRAADLAPTPPLAAEPVKAAPATMAPEPAEARFVPPPPPPLPKIEAVKAAPPRVERPTPAPLPARRLTQASAPAPSARPAFHCDWALRPSERMVCNDAELAALDNRLNRAFNAAVRAGAPRSWLREEQDRWVMVDRERAARHSRWAVEDLYRERIAELDDLARGPESEP